MTMSDVTPSLEILGRRIASDAPPYVVAEISANHNGSLEAALELIASAKQQGADAVKIQTYRPETITLDSDREEFRIRGGLWDGRTLHDLYREAHTPWEWHEALFRRARELGITIFSSPFDATAVDLLESLGTPAYKIASFEAVDLPLIQRVARTRKPVIISTGMASEAEIHEAIAAARRGGCEQLAILHCVSAYPAPPGEYDLRTLADMARRFGVVVGISDHTLESATAVGAVALGASIVEKHFTLDRSGGGPDDSFSLLPEELGPLCRDVRSVWSALGSVRYGPSPSEMGSMKFRRSLFVTKNVRAGELVDLENVRSIRPGYGLPCKHLPELVGRSFAQDVERGTPLAWGHLEHATPDGSLSPSARKE